MYFKSGDRVRFLNEVGEGKVLKQLPNGKVLVLTSDGFEIEFPLNQIVLADPLVLEERKKEKPIEKRFESKKWEPADCYFDFDKIQYDNKIYLAIECSDVKNISAAHFNLNFFNNTKFSVYFSAHRCISAQLHESIVQQNIKAGSLAFWYQLQNKELNSLLPLRFDILFSSESIEEIPTPLTLHTKLKAVNIVNSANYKPIKGFDSLYYLIKLYDLQNPKQIEDFKEDKKNFTPSAPNKKAVIPEVLEVDLHAEALLDNYKTMKPSEILAFQLSTFRHKLEYAIANRCKKVIFIHGVGSGVLKTEIHKILKEYVDLKFRDASMLKYGNGATEVLIEF